MSLTCLNCISIVTLIIIIYSRSIFSNQLITTSNQTNLVASLTAPKAFQNANHNFTKEQLFTNCGGSFKSHQTIITTPNYPGIYPPNVNCEYVFKSPYVCKSQFHVQFLDFILESSDNCIKDKLIIENSETICGQVIGTKIYNTTNGLFRMLFHSDSQGVFKGFRLLVTRLPCEDEHGQGYLETTSYNDPVIMPNINQRQLVSDWIAGRNKYQFNNSKQYLPPVNGYVPNIPNTEFGPDYNSPQYPSYNPVNIPYFPAFICIPQVSERFPQNVPAPGSPPNFTPIPPQSPAFPRLPVPYPDRNFNNFNNHLPTPGPHFYNPLPTTSFPTNNNFPQFPSLPKVEPQVAPSLPGTIPACCTRNFNERRFYLSSPNFPNFNLDPTDCLFYIEKFGANTCRLRIELKYFTMGVANPQGCYDDFLEIDGQRICGCRTGLIYTSQWGLGAKVLRVRSSGGRNGGFLVELIQEDCPYRYVGNEIIQKRIDEPYQRALVETNSTMRSLYTFYGDGKDVAKNVGNSYESATEGPSSQFLFGSFNSNKCSFTITDWLRLSVDPLWLTRPRC